MGGRVGRTAHAISCHGHDLVTVGDDGTDGHLAVRRRFGREVERTAHGWRQGEAHRPRASARRKPSHIALLLAAASAFRPGRSTTSAGTFTVVSLAPTFTEPVSTSKAGACPPFAVTPLREAASCGASAPRIWLMFTKPLAIAAMTMMTATMTMNSTARMVLIP